MFEKFSFKRQRGIITVGAYHLCKNVAFEAIVESRNLAVRKLAEADAGSYDQDEFHFIVFSKNRPVQLLATIESFRANVKGNSSVTVLYKSTDHAYKAAYHELINAMDDARFTFVEEGHFEKCLKDIVNGVQAGNTCFLVDDIIFIRDVNLEKYAGFISDGHVISLRLGESIDYCYTTGHLHKVPALQVIEDEFVMWEWAASEGDWRYPGSIDGNIFSTPLIKAVIQVHEASHPSDLENVIDSYRGLLGACPGIAHRESRVINIPANRVHDENNNRHMGLNESLLLTYWQEGKKIDTTALRNTKTNSAHCEIDYTFIER